jgi:hypothetical protein
MRGYQKKVVCLKSTGSDVFEEAYFILKEKTEIKDRTDLVREASRIIEESTGVGKKRYDCRLIPRGLIIFSAGFISAAVIVTLVLLII